MRTVKKDYILHVRVPENVYKYIVSVSSARGWLKSAVVLDMIESYIRADKVFSTFQDDAKTIIND